MLKLSGVALILAGACGLGMHEGQEIAGRVEEWRNILQMAELLKGELRCANASLPEAFEAASLRMDGNYRDFLRAVSEELKKHTGKPVDVIIRECVGKYFCVSYMRTEEKRELILLGKHLGYLDLAVQIRQIEMFEEQIQQKIRQAQNSMEEKKRIFWRLGILGGFFLVILMW
ncbi:MAG: stage III sporulation protein AB [Blautia sp.]|nr:stage III sporulation protein AB [Blautia sp.]MDY5031012.1 stage III sporulation protein AB [Blautia sp.]